MQHAIRRHAIPMMAAVHYSSSGNPARRRGIGWIWLTLILLLQGCSSWSLPPHWSAEPGLPAQTFHFRDGGEAIFFSLDKSLQLQPAANRAPSPATYLFFISGSDCTSMQYFLPQYFRGLEGESGRLRIFVLHKRFIAARTWGRFAGCSEAFIHADHPSRWIADQTEFIQAQLLQARQAGNAPGRIVIVGVSEGGDSVPVLARNIPAVTHAVILANGGMNPLDAYRLQAGRHGLADAVAALAALDQPAPIDQDDVAARIHNRSFRYWAELRDLRHTDALATLTIPIMMAMGEADEMVPIESLRYLQQHFAWLGKTNLSVMTFSNADHALNGPAGSQLPNFWLAFDRWLAK